MFLIVHLRENKQVLEVQKQDNTGYVAKGD